VPESVIKLQFSIRSKLILSIVLPLIMITMVVMGFTLSRIFEYASINIRRQHETELALYADVISARFETLGQIAATTAGFMAQNALPEPETLYARLNSLVADNPLVYGAAIAFEPFAYQEDTRLF